MKCIIAFSALLPSLVFAGGDYVSGKVSDFTGNDGEYSFTFAAERTLVGLEACSVLKVHVTHKRVPWLSWLPFVHSSHPTQEQTNMAAVVLKQAAEAGHPALFGYLGDGLIASGAPCTFRSHGLLLDDNEGKELVLSFYDRTGASAHTMFQRTLEDSRS
ncbi:hypothetical protein [Nitrogeniibacter aestuarii]|uniref:hypothetical protein n=1 Tax=Nitrogeniibacter aestuarii TaxID=2815343 RepID=UPI001D10DF28|nr:hypothetical protein [Nitrogeniibacter aestuarii]